MTALSRRVESKDNPLVQRIRKLVADPMAYRKLGHCWLEGEHLVLAVKQRGVRAALGVMAESAVNHPSALAVRASSADTVCLSDKVWAGLSQLPASAGMGLLMEPPLTLALQAQVPTVVLDRLQDAGNVGSILRSAAALGIRQVVALRGTAGLWSHKVLRAGMGAQWGLHLLEGQDPAILQGLGVPMLATSSHGGVSLSSGQWPEAGAWIFGHEGQGVSEEVLERCHSTVCIPQPGGEESLNVAAAAAICLYESMRRRSAA